MFSFSLRKYQSLERPGEPGTPGVMTLIGLKETYRESRDVFSHSWVTWEFPLQNRPEK